MIYLFITLIMLFKNGFLQYSMLDEAPWQGLQPGAELVQQMLLPRGPGTYSKLYMIG